MADLAEDLLIMALLLNPNKITDFSVRWLAAFSGTKLVSVTVSILQVLALAGLSWRVAV